MVTEDHAEWRRRVLGYEELEPDERHEVDVHLTTCTGCASLLSRLRAVERDVRGVGSLAEEEHPLSGLDPSAQAAAQASLEALRSRIAANQGQTGLATKATGGRGFWIPIRLRWGLTALTATAAMLIFVRRIEERPNLLSHPAIGPYSGVRGTPPET